VRSLSGEHTVVVSSHNLPEISETCDRLLVINDGRIVADGTELELTKTQRGMRVELTVRSKGGDVAERAELLVAKVASVSQVRAVEAREPGEGVATLSVISEGDVRDEICRVLVAAEFGILQLSRAERELESAFLELLRSDAGQSSAQQRRAAKRLKASGARPPGAAQNQENPG